MTEDLITHDHNLAEGDVALVFKKDGDLMITHNIAKVRETNRIDGQENAAGFLLAIACTIALGQENLAGVLLAEAARRLESLEMPATPITIQ